MSDRPDPLTETLGATAARWFRDARRAGAPSFPEGLVSGQAGSVGDGLVVRLWLGLDAERIGMVRYQVFGGPAAMACAAWTADQIEGATLAQAGRLKGAAMVRALALPAAATGEALVVEDALREALAKANRAWTNSQN